MKKQLLILLIFSTIFISTQPMHSQLFSCGCKVAEIGILLSPAIYRIYYSKKRLAFIQSTAQPFSNQEYRCVRDALEDAGVRRPISIYKSSTNAGVLPGGHIYFEPAIIDAYIAHQKKEKSSKGISPTFAAGTIQHEASHLKHYDPEVGILVGATTPFIYHSMLSKIFRSHQNPKLKAMAAITAPFLCAILGRGTMRAHQIHAERRADEEITDSIEILTGCANTFQAAANHPNNNPPTRWHRFLDPHQSHQARADRFRERARMLEKKSL